MIIILSALSNTINKFFKNRRNETNKWKEDVLKTGIIKCEQLQKENFADSRKILREHDKENRKPNEINSARKNPNRATKPPKNYYEEDIPNDDRYIYCDTCKKERLDFCATCGPLVVLRDENVRMGVVQRARRTAPKGVIEIRHSPIHGNGAFALKTIPKGVLMGPYQGRTTRMTISSGYSWKLRDGRMIDAGDETTSNWLRFVNCSTNWTSQNVVAFQYKGAIYYRTVKDVEKDEELLVFYGHTFAKQLGIDTKRYFDKNEEEGEKNDRKDKKEEEKAKVQEEEVKEQEEEGKVQGGEDKVELQEKEALKRVGKGKKQQEEANGDCFPCKFCSIGLSTIFYRDSHEVWCTFRPNRRDFFGKTFPCAFCHVELTTEEYRTRHEKYCSKKERRHKRPRSSQKFACLECDYVANRKDSLKKHQIIHQKHKPIYKCETCSFKSFYKNCLKNHEKTHNILAEYKCSFCPKTFNGKSNLNEHLLRHHFDKSRGLVASKLHECQVCHVQTTRMTYLMTHGCLKRPRDNFCCLHCDFVTNQKRYLVAHMRRHGVKPYVCVGCKKTYSNKRSLVGHVFNCHKDDAQLLEAFKRKV